MNRDDRLARLARAKDCLVVAAAALTEPPDDNTVAGALLLAAIAIIHLQAADPDEAALTKVIHAVQTQKEKRDAPGV